VNSLKELRATRFYINNVLKNNSNHPLVETIARKCDRRCNPLPYSSNEAVKIARSEFALQKSESNLIVMLTSRCPQICSSCFMAESMGSPTPREEIEHILDGVERSPGLVEITLSGGEPLSVEPGILSRIADRLREINGKRGEKLLVTIATRLPVVAPHLLANGRMDALVKLAPTGIDIHVLHPDEVTAEFSALCRRISRTIPGVSLRTNHPLLKGINDSAEMLRALFVKLAAEAGVMPGRLMLPMPGPTPEKLMVSLERGMEIIRELHRIVPSQLVPSLLAYSPISGKSIVDPFHLKKDGSFGFDVTPDGRLEGMFIKDGSGLQHACAVKLEASCIEKAA